LILNYRPEAIINKFDEISLFYGLERKDLVANKEAKFKLDFAYNQVLISEKEFQCDRK